MSTAYIALGSNLDNPAGQLQLAVTAIDGWQHSNIANISSVYSSAAIGPGEQANYLNAVLSLNTELSPATLLAELQTLENCQGRVRRIRWGARTLDLDILLYDDRKVRTNTLEIPHPAMQQRHFVLYPLAEIADPQMLLPCGTNLETLLARCPREDLSLTTITLHRSTNPGQVALP